MKGQAFFRYNTSSFVNICQRFGGIFCVYLYGCLRHVDLLDYLDNGKQHPSRKVHNYRCTYTLISQIILSLIQNRSCLKVTFCNKKFRINCFLASYNDISKFSLLFYRRLINPLNTELNPICQ